MAPSPRFSRFTRQALFFLLAIVVPCALLVFLTIRMQVQEGELAEKRAADERRRLVTNVGQELMARLERTASRAALQEPPTEELVTLARAEGDRLLLPWESADAVAAAAAALEDASFRDAIAAGERAEFLDRDFGRAAGAYRSAQTSATLPVQRASAALYLARTLGKLGDDSQAAAVFEALLGTPLDVIDDQGIPLALYAARALADSPGPARTGVHDVLRRAGVVGSLPPAAVYMLRDIAAPSEAPPDVARTIARRVDDLEQLAELQKRFPALRATGADSGGDFAWTPFGSRERLWLVGVPGARSDVVVVARAQPMVDSLQAVRDAGAGFVVNAEGRGEPFGAALTGLWLELPPAVLAAAAQELRVQRPLYLAMLVLVLSTALFGAYLFSRDVRRELRIAELRSQFVSSVSHELKTPLTAIRMFAETLLMGRSQRPEVAQEYLETIVNESERLTRLLNNVLDFSKIEQGTKTYRLEPSSPADVVRAAARAMEYPLAQQGFELRVNVAEHVPLVAADADAIQQALLNLLSNAMKYSGDGRVIELCLSRDGANAVFAVTDHGIGIAESEQCRIFEKFYRVHSEATQRIAGTGLGLTLVDHVARAHGGSVIVHSVPGEGSTFSIVVPLLPEATAALAGVGAPA